MNVQITEQRYPGGSKTRVNRAGDNVRLGTHTQEDLNVIAEWRGAHRAVLNTFQAILRTRTRDKNITVAQRHKRKSTIFNKLQRLSKIQLSRMDDIAGCRLIFNSIDELREFRRQFHDAKFNHKRKNDDDKYDYIKNPKSSGYRGIHDVYEYDVNSIFGKDLKGLYVEIQYRTKIQHAWATAVEVVGYLTTSQPKFQTGDTRYHETMALASEILSRAHEGLTGPLPELKNHEVVERFNALDSELNILMTLRSLNAADASVGKNTNTILIFSDDGSLEIKTFKDATTALTNLFVLENMLPEKDIVLVRAETSEEIRFAFKNYFSDAREFITLVNSGIKKLAKTKA